MSMIEYTVRSTPGEVNKRFIGIESDIPVYDPCCLYDVFELKPPHIYFDHPHKGFVDIAYIYQGEISYQDSLENKYKLTDGDLMVCAVGSGVSHGAYTRTKVVGVNIWINQKDKNSVPYFKMTTGEDCTKHEGGGVEAKILLGQAFWKNAKISLATADVTLIDFTLQPGARLKRRIPSGWNAIIYVLKGTLAVNEMVIGEDKAALFKDDRQLFIRNRSDKPVTFLYYCAKPNKAPYYRGDEEFDFIADSKEDFNKVKDDYKKGANGFKELRAWNSELNY